MVGFSHPSSPRIIESYDLTFWLLSSILSDNLRIYKSLGRGLVLCVFPPLSLGLLPCSERGILKCFWVTQFIWRKNLTDRHEILRDCSRRAGVFLKATHTKPVNKNLLAVLKFSIFCPFGAVKMRETAVNTNIQKSLAAPFEASYYDVSSLGDV